MEAARIPIAVVSVDKTGCRSLLLFDSPEVVASVTKERAMEIYRPGISLFETTMYRISILGTLDKNWSDYCGGMTIEHLSDPKGYAMSILTGRLADQSALIGVLNSLHDIGCPILSFECLEAG
jgi:hypothetical protein